MFENQQENQKLVENDFEARQNITEFFGMSLKINAKIKFNFSMRQKTKKSKYEFLWKLIKLLFLLLRIIPLFIN